MMKGGFKGLFCLVLISMWAVCVMGETPVREERYDVLLERSVQLTERSKSIQNEMKELIAQIEGGDSSSTTRGRYLELELELMSIRGELTTVSDSLALLSLGRESRSEQLQVAQTESSNARSFSSDARFIKALGERDMQNLKRSESLERSVSIAINEYISAINELSKVRDSYNRATSQQSGMALKSEYDSLFVMANELSVEIQEDWDYIYDNKSYSYDLLLEINAKSEVAATLSSLRDSTLRASAEWVTEPLLTTLKEYILQKQELLNVELVTSRALGMAMLADSINMAAVAFSKMSRRYPTVELTPRTFIDYKDAEILTRQIYNTANPIPQTKIYEHGIVYRIRVGSFLKKQSPSIFRFSTEVSYVPEKNGSFTYYIGGYATYAEAIAAQTMLKSAGFRRPEVVVWSSGQLRNLAENPYSQDDVFRIEISGRETLGESLPEEIKATAKGATISKMGSLYVVYPVEGEALALQLAQIIARHGSDIIIELKKL